MLPLIPRGVSMFDKIEMGNRMYAARSKKNIKQWEMGNLLGIKQPSYSDMETGKTDITIPQLFTIANALEVPVTWLLGLENRTYLSYEENVQVEEFIRYLISKRKK